VLGCDAVGDLFGDATASAAGAVDEEADFLKGCLGDVQCCVDGSEDDAPGTLDVVVEAGELVAVPVEDLTSVGYTEVLD
jgi:hypothetical protein